MPGLQRQHVTSVHQKGRWLGLYEHGLADRTGLTFSENLDSQGCIYSVQNNVHSSATYITLTSLVVIVSVTKMQKTVIPSPTRAVDCETDGHGLVVAVAMSWGKSVVNWPFAAVLSISHTPYLRCYVDLIDTTSFTNSYMLTCTNFVSPSSVSPNTL